MSETADRLAARFQPPRMHRAPLAERLAVRWARARRWEFWPAWLWYLPVIAYIVARGLWARSPTVFTAANPAMEAGGVCGDRKRDVLGPAAVADPDLVAPFEIVPVDAPLAARTEQVVRFAGVHGWPVVLKPDVGQRGRGVQVIRDAGAARDYLRRAPGDVLVQRHVEGAEFGVFVYRDPRSGAAQVYSVTHKTFPSVTGDGRRTLEALIRDDPRARLISPFLWVRWASRMAWVPAPKQVIPLIEIGAHCRGALFLDARDRITEALKNWAGRVLRAVPGYHFGRIDVRCPSPAHLARGEGIRILEFNGVTAEAAHIYHPGTPILDGYRSMIGQWRLAFAIGEANARAGAAVTGPLALLRRFRDDLRRGEGWF